jgi:hypothetical protein
MTSIGTTPASYITTLLQTTGPVFHGRTPGRGPEDTDEAANAILKIVNTISVQAAAASKAAAAKIGDAALSAAERWALPNHGSSPGVRYYERLEDIEDPAERAAMMELAKTQAEEKARTPGMHHWPAGVIEGHKIFSLIEDYFKTDFSYTTGRVHGGVVLEQSNMGTLRFLGQLQTKITELTSEMAKETDISGDIIVQGPDGQLRIGNFEVRDKKTGDLYMKMDSDNTIRFYDKGVILHEFGFDESEVTQ